MDVVHTLQIYKKNATWANLILNLKFFIIKKSLIFNV